MNTRNMATKKPKGLGRGLDALLGGSADFAETVPTVTGAPTLLKVGALQAGKYQPRTRMDEGALNELAASIKAQGVLQAILVRLLNLANPVQTMLMAGDIDMGHARALLAVDAANQITMANQIVSKRLSVREAEKLVTRATLNSPAPGRQGASTEKSRDIAGLEEELSDQLATRVTIKMNGKKKGQLIIDFANLDALDGIIAKLRA